MQLAFAREKGVWSREGSGRSRLDDSVSMQAVSVSVLSRVTLRELYHYVMSKSSRKESSQDGTAESASWACYSFYWTRRTLRLAQANPSSPLSRSPLEKPSSNLQKKKPSNYWLSSSRQHPPTGLKEETSEARNRETRLPQVFRTPSYYSVLVRKIVVTHSNSNTCS
jgi:hypothetical protein